jgi:hypothetical protein
MTVVCIVLRVRRHALVRRDRAFEDCPLIEIVHFHRCLRGELQSLRTNVGQLRIQVS